jgi:hypothetical protein
MAEKQMGGQVWVLIHLQHPIQLIKNIVAIAGGQYAKKTVDNHLFL